MSGGANGHADAAQAVDAARKLINKQGPKPEPAVTVAADAHGFDDATSRMAVQLRYNVRKMLPEILWTAFNDWTEYHDREEARLLVDIEEQFRFRTGKEPTDTRPARFQGHLRWLAIQWCLAQNEVDPVEVWLRELPKWDGTARLDNLLRTVFVVDENDDNRDLVTWASRAPVLGAVWRTFHPGHQLDTMPVLVGEQGIGKSTFFRYLLPPEHRHEWYGDGLPLSADDKQRVEHLQGRLIVEASELAGADRTDMESLKAFISKINDGTVRLAWRRNPESMPRRCVLVGTTNERESLPNDPSGNRRFCPVPVAGRRRRGKLIGATFVREYLDTYRAQLWAEALQLFADGVPAHLTDDLADKQATVTEQFRRRDNVLEDAVAAFLSAGPPTPFSSSMAAAGTGLASTVGDAVKLSQRDQKRLSAALRSAGYERKRGRLGGGQLAYRWYPK